MQRDKKNGERDARVKRDKKTKSNSNAADTVQTSTAEKENRLITTQTTRDVSDKAAGSRTADRAASETVLKASAVENTQASDSAAINDSVTGLMEARSTVAAEAGKAANKMGINSSAADNAAMGTKSEYGASGQTFFSDTEQAAACARTGNTETNAETAASNVASGQTCADEGTSPRGKKNLIRFENVTKIYQMGEVKIEALGGVDFTIDEGEFTVVLGASGAGKSTILNILGGMDKATAGKVIVDGEEVSSFNAKKLTNYRRFKVGFVFQFYNLIANLNALENVEFAASVTPNHLNAFEILDSVGLGERAKNFPSQLSGGEQQRVAIARAVAKNPMLLLCDEPTGALDYKTGKMVLKLLQDVNERYGKTVVLITHNSYLAPMADKVIRVRSGKVENVVMNERKLPVDEIDW